VLSTVFREPVIPQDGDTQLVARARRGEAAAREALARRYLRPAYAVALATVRNVADAEDLAQEVLVTALERLDQCRDPARFAPWLLQSVRHRALNHLEQGRNRGSLLKVLEGGASSGGGEPPVLLRRRLLAALQEISPIQREVVLLHDLQAWAHREIADALDISEVMSRQHLFVARRTMRAFLSKDQDKESGHGR